jgi:hypothetical protein
MLDFHKHLIAFNLHLVCLDGPGAPNQLRRCNNYPRPVTVRLELGRLRFLDLLRPVASRLVEIRGEARKASLYSYQEVKEVSKSFLPCRSAAVVQSVAV